MAAKKQSSVPTIYIEIKGGMIEEIHASFPAAVIFIADRDLLIPPPMGDKLNQDADARLAQADLHKVY